MFEQSEGRHRRDAHAKPGGGSSADKEESPSMEEDDVLHSQGPPHPKRRLLVSLLGGVFADVNQPALQVKSADDTADEEMEMYRRSPSVPLCDDPLEWWQRHEGSFPLLSRLAKRYLCIPGTSVSAERVFSTAGDVVTAKRTSLSTSLCFYIKTWTCPNAVLN